MVQRLGLAVAVLADAPIVLLDEPTAALDPAGLEAFYSLVEQMKREGRTLLFTSHQLGDVEQLADRFAVLVDGRLAAVLTKEELAARVPDRKTMRLHAFYRDLTGGASCPAH
jgi:ABC-type multidrug transport system ATPase subunit